MGTIITLEKCAYSLTPVAIDPGNLGYVQVQLTISCYMYSKAYLVLVPRIMEISNLELSNCKFNFHRDFYPDVVSLKKMVYLNMISESCEHRDSRQKFLCSVDVT